MPDDTDDPEDPAGVDAADDAPAGDPDDSGDRKADPGDPGWETVPDDGAGSERGTGSEEGTAPDDDPGDSPPEAGTDDGDSPPDAGTDDDGTRPDAAPVTGTDDDGAGPDAAPAAGTDDDATAGSTSGAGAADPVLRTRGLTKRFGELVAVDAVDLDIPHGEFRSVIGPNGAGKTTLFNLITGALAPSAGTVEFEGEDVTGLAPHRRVRRGLGRSFQITNVFGGLTVRENVRLAAQAVRREELGLVDRFFRSKERPRSIAEATDEVLDRIGLAAQGEERAGALAYGDRRRLEIGLVLATDPEVILLDEPTAGMSVDETRETMRLIDDVLADRTLVLIEHDIDLVMDVSDRVTVLNRGSVLTTGTPREVADDREVQRAYLGGARP